MQIREHTSGQGGANKAAIIHHPSGTVISFDELEARANRLAHYFRQAGLVEGDAVAILMENNEHIHAVMWAARRSGLYYVPINTLDLSSLERVIHAAAPCPVEIKKQMIDWWGPIIDEYYASSEAIGSTLISAEEWLAHPGSVGKPMMCQLHILDEDGNELPPGQPGEIYFEGLSCCRNTEW